MSKLVKNIIALSISSALSLGFITSVNASTYQIIDKGEASKLKYTYAQHQNINGDMAMSGTNIYNFPVQFKYLDDDDFNAIEAFALFYYQSVHSLNNIEDADALRAGTPTGNDLAWVVRWLKSTDSTGKGRNIEYQKIGDTIAMTNIDGISQDYPLWDTTFDGSDSLTRSTTDILSGITNTGILYGTATAPYLPSVKTDSHGVETTYWMREFGQRGFFSFGQGAEIFPVTPLLTDYSGGISAVLDVNETAVAVGYSSYKVSEKYIDYIENGATEMIKVDDEDKEVDTIRDITGISSFVSVDLVDANQNDGVDDEFDSDYVIRGCNDAYILKHIPYNVCVYFVEQYLGNPHHIIATKSILSGNGEVITEPLGLLVTPHEDDERVYTSYALAINNNGVAVGYADGFIDETVAEPAENENRAYHYAVVYKNGEVLDLSGDHSDKGNSRAYDINDAGIAVGHITKAINGKGVQKLFYVDTSVPKEEINMITPDDFFSGSDSTARAINNNGLIVGEGEIETHNEGTNNPRRTAAFLYDMNADLFTNLNKTIPCALRQTYDIIEARGINDNGIISATAIVKAERRDAKGEIMLDANGAPLTEDVVRAISLQPTPENGEVCTSEEEDKVVRQGASISLGGMLSLLALFGLRRKFFK